MARDQEILDLIKLPLTPDIFNQQTRQGINDLTPMYCEVYRTQLMEMKRARQTTACNIGRLAGSGSRTCWKIGYNRLTRSLKDMIQ